MKTMLNWNFMLCSSFSPQKCIKKSLQRNTSSVERLLFIAKQKLTRMSMYEQTFCGGVVILWLAYFGCQPNSLFILELFVILEMTLWLQNRRFLTPVTGKRLALILWEHCVHGPASCEATLTRNPVDVLREHSCLSAWTSSLKTHSNQNGGFNMFL